MENILPEHQSGSNCAQEGQEISASTRIVAVIVAYEPELNNLIALIHELQCQQVPSVLIDNGTLPPPVIEELRQIATVIRLDNNEGIAKAQNIGIAHACSQYNAELIIFFDQDSRIDRQFISGMLKDYEHVTALDKVAAIGPIFTDSRYGFYYPLIRVNKFGWRTKVQPQGQQIPFEVSMLISSGSIIPVAVLREVGAMNEQLFIDYVDTEWCLRAISMGYKIYAATSTKMSHAIGDKTIKVFAWHLPVHSAFRRYYRLRNGWYLARMKHIPPLMKIRENLFNTLHQLLLIITQPNKRNYLSIWYRAFKDGVNLK